MDYRESRAAGLDMLCRAVCLATSISLSVAGTTQPPQLSEASQLMRVGDYTRARPILEKLIAQVPRSPEAHNLLGVCLRELENPQGSVAQFKIAVQLDPGYENAWLNLGSTLFSLHDDAGAVSVFNKLLHLHPESKDGHLLLAKILLAQGDEFAAVQHLERVIQLDPNNTFALANAGLIESRKGALDKATSYISRALAQDPQNLSLQLALSELYLKRGQMVEAAKLADEVGRNPALTKVQRQTLAILLLNSGLTEKGVALVSGDTDLAEQFWNAAMARAKQRFLANKLKDTVTILSAIQHMRPQDAALHDLLGVAWNETGDTRRASDELQEAIRLEPRNPEGYIHLGLVYLKHHTPELAEVVFEHGVAQVPDSAWLWLGLGLSQHFRDDTTRAQQSVQKALMIDPGLVEGYVVLGDILESDGRLSEASGIFHQAIEKNPNLYIGYYYCGMAALEAAGESQAEQALAFLTKAVALNPDFAEAHYERGRALEQLHQIPQALAEYKTSLAKNQGLSKAHYRLALIYRKQGQTREADDELNRFEKTKLKEKDAVLERLEYRIRQP